MLASILRWGAICYIGCITYLEREMFNTTEKRDVDRGEISISTDVDLRCS